MSAEGLKAAGGTNRTASTAVLSPGLSPRELEVIKSLDSRSFGFLDLGKTPSASGGAHGYPGIVSRDLLQQGITTLQEQLASGPPTDTFRGETFCQLGHLHLLLEEHTQALSAYQQYQTLCPSSAMNPNFHYGAGLIYFHLKSYNWAMEAFRKVLILSPNFARANEIHLRLGVLCKMKGEYMSSLEHLQEAACTPGPTSLGRLEIQFHIGHLHHLKGQHLAAKKVYEGILATQPIPSNIRAMALRQLGWLYHTAPTVCSPSENSSSKALELLKLAVGADPSSGQTWYFLGRCHSAQGRAHEAFMAYQQAVNKSEDDQADTWCSIGVLYHNMNQPRDSLQAYLCAAYLDSCSTPAWSNLGCLYEAVAQPIDALICYKNAIMASQKAPSKNKSMEYTFSRIASLERYVRTLGTALLGQPRAIPSVYESWNSLIPSHIRKRHPRPDSPLLHLPGFQPSSLPTTPALPSFRSLPLPSLPGSVLSNRLSGHVPKRPRISRTKDPIILKSMSERWLSPGVRSPLTPSFSATTFPFPVLSPVSQTPFLPGMTLGNGIGHMVPDMKSPDLKPGKLTAHSLPTALDSARNPGLFRMTTGPSPGGMGMGNGVDPLGGIGLDTSLTPDSSLLGEIQSSQGLSAPDNFSTMVDTLTSGGGLPLNLSASALSARTRLTGSRGSLSSPSSVTLHPFRDAGHVCSSLTDVFQRPTPNGVLSDSNGLPTDRPTDLALLPRKRSSSGFPTPVCPLSATSSHFAGDLLSRYSSPVSPASSVGERPLAVPSGRWTKAPCDAVSENSPTTPSSNGPVLQRAHALGSVTSPVFSTGSTSVLLPSSLASTSNGSYSIASLPRQPYSQSRISPPSANTLASNKLRKLSESSVNSGIPPNVNPFSDGTFGPAVKMGDLLQKVSVFDTHKAPPFHTISTLPRGSHSETTPSHTRAEKSSVSDGLGTDLPGDLSVISPLNFDSGMEEYLDHFLNGSQSQESLGLGLHEMAKKASTERQASEHAHVSILNPSLNGFFADSETRREGRVPPCSPLDKAASAPAGSWITAQSPRLLSPRQEVQVLKVPNGRVSPHDSESTPSPRQLVMTTEHDNQFQASSAKRPTSLSPRPPPEDNHLSHLLLSPHKSPSEGDTPTRERDSGIGETTAVSETVSDSSSVFSCREAKLSTTSSASPLASPNPSFTSPKASPLTFTPSPLATSTHFGYPYPLPGEAGDDWSPVPSPTGRVSPIPEPHPSLGEEGEYMLQDPELRPPDPPPHTDDVSLNPKVPIYQVSSAKDALSSTLHSFCSRPSQHICMIRGIAEALDLDMELFSTKKLVKACSDHMIEVREQVPQAADENWDPIGRNQAWLCESNRSFTTITEYGRYQNRILLNKEDYSTQSDCSDSASDSTGERRSRKLLRFGTNVDLSDRHKWSKQLKVLEKLPPFLQVSSCRGNLLSHIGHTVLGMNSVQLYMKVPGSRTPGHQENNNFCSVNINIGPGDCEWFAVPNQYWGVIHDLCEKNKLSFLVGSWWPILEELRERKVPVYRFTQYMGDLVWINPGTVHWVQANNVCNNVAWNLGPLTAHQFRMSWERYQWNKIQRVHSIVPMVHLTWNLVKTVKIRNETLYKQIRTLLESSLQQTHRLLSQLKRAKIPVHWHGRMEGESAPYCQNCLEEVFNILFVQSHRGEYIVYCHKCAASMRKNFTVLRQYSTEQLEETLASYKLYTREKAKR